MMHGPTHIKFFCFFIYPANKKPSAANVLNMTTQRTLVNKEKLLAQIQSLFEL